MVRGDGVIGQMMEPVVMPESFETERHEKSWAATGWDRTRPRAVINSLYIKPDVLEKHNQKLEAKYQAMREREVMVETQFMDDARYALVAYGTTARIALTAVRRARAEGIPVGLIRRSRCGPSRRRKAPGPPGA
jgi:2-oxoglutarate ferredoxin oxidoreductase subunit alpha